MRNMGSFRLLLLVGVLSVSIFSLNTFAMLPAALVVTNQPQLLQSAFATFPGENGKIAFVSQRDGGPNNPDIYVMNADGSEQRNISNNPLLERFPSWSPDGTKIAFSAFEYIGGVYTDADIYVMNADGSGVTKLTDHPSNDNYPDWSPDGTKILFTSERDNTAFAGNEIYVMNADGSEQTRLADGPNNFSPKWSPDGTKIAFSAGRNNNHDIYVMNAEGSGQTRLTTHAGADSTPDWSPDGTKIAYSRDLDGNGNNYEVYVMNSDGTGVTNLSNNPSWDSDPSWSPDGTKITFLSFRDASCCGEIYVMNADGSGQVRLTTESAYELHPDWGTATDTEPTDTIPPVITVPEDMVVDALTANGGTVVTYNVTAEDNVDGTATLEEDGSLIQDDIGGNITISCDPPSGSEFPIGDTEVQCMATDEAGNVGGPESFTVTVNPPPPVLDPLTAEISSNATEGVAPSTFEFEAAVTGGTAPYSYRWDFGDGTTEESIEPTTSHTYDEPGTYTVTLTVIDSEGQETTDSLEVTVNEPSTEPPPPPGPTTPREAIEDLISFIQNLQGVPEGAKTGIVTSLERALALLSDDNTRNDASACNMFGAFMNQVDARERRGSLTEVQADDLRTQAEDIRDMLDC